MAGVLRYVALTGSPAATGTSAGLAAYRFTHNPEASLKLAVLAGVLTFVSLVALALAQLAESWICHRSEHHFSYTLKRAVKVATNGAKADRRDAALTASEKLGITDLTQGALNAMWITREAPDATRCPTTTEYPKPLDPIRNPEHGRNRGNVNTEEERH